MKRRPWVERITLPINKLERVIKDKGVSVARRGEGECVAVGRLVWGDRRLGGAGIASLRCSGKRSATQRAQIARTRQALEAGLADLAGLLRGGGGELSAGIGPAVKAPVRLEVLAGHDVVLDLVPARSGKEGAPAREEPAVIRVDADTAGGDGNLGPLYALGLLYCLCLIAGEGENAALLRLLQGYEALEPQARGAVDRVLERRELDSGGIFQRFLRSASGASVAERERLAAWLRGRSRIEVPYSAEGVRRAIATETDLASLRMAIYDAINDTYVEAVDTANAERWAAWCLERGVRLVGGRFSRALYIDAMLMASAQALPSGALRPSVEALERLLVRTAVKLSAPGLRGQELRLDGLRPEGEKVLALLAKPSVSVAEVEGTISKLQKALGELESSALARIDRAQSAALADRSRRTSRAELRTFERDRAAVRLRTDRVRRAIAAIESAAADAPRRDPAFIVFFQRLFPLDAINMGLINELLDPFFSEDDDLLGLIRNSGHNLYTTPNLSAWLRHCDDWIEALPAYATYEIIPKEGEGYDVRAWVQRGILEDMYRRHAEDWALNIEAVTASQHVAVARELLAEHTALGRAADQLARREKTSREEAIRSLVEARGLEETVGHLAALVERSAENLCLEVAGVREQQELTYAEAVERVIGAGRSRGNLVAACLAAKDSVAQAAARAVRRHGLVKRAAVLAELAAQRTRNLPHAHVLTTLGPGETEMNVRNWLEEAMGLFNVSRAYGLEQQVAERVEEYRRRLVAMGRRMTQEMDLEGELFGLMRERGLDADHEEDRAEGILAMLGSYPEVSAEAAKLALLLDHQERQGAPRNPDGAEEPEAVLRYLEAHPEVRARATQRVVEENDLGAAVEAEMQRSGRPEEEAAEAVIAGSAEHCQERDSLALSEARQQVLNELGLAGEVRGYVRARLDAKLASVLARRELIAEQGLAAELDNPRFRYEATGPFKRYHLLYTPSRVDLGADEIRSVREVPKWVGGLDREAANSGRALYALYNTAGPTAVASPRLAEFLKVGENFFSRGGVYYLSLTAGANLDALRFGDFEFFRDQWNMRGDRLVLPTGETYGGFCVPKEFSLLYAIILAAVNPRTGPDVLANFGVPAALHETVLADLRRLLKLRAEAEDTLAWERRAREFLAQRYAAYFEHLTEPACIARLPHLAETLEQAGVLAATDEQGVRQQYELACWINKKAQGLEEINRSGPFRKVHLICELIKQARRQNAEIAPDRKLIGVMSAPYKEGERKDGKEVPITDVRFSAGARKLEIYAGTAEHHLLKDIDPPGRQVLRELLRDFQSPADIRIVGTCTASDLLNHVPASGLEAEKDRVLRMLVEAGMSEAEIDTNCTLYGGDLESWPGVKELPPDRRAALVQQVGGRIHLAVLERRGLYRSYEEAVQGSDFLDLGIPDPELLDLVDDLPRLLHLMRRGRPNSALVLADGTSGARRRTFSYRYASSKRKVKELAALDERVVYGALGLGRDTVEQWRREALTERREAEELWDAVVAGDRQRALASYGQIVRRVRREAKAEEAADEVAAARKYKVEAASYVLRARALGRVQRGLALERVDFGTWVLLGGMYVLNGRLSADEIQQCREQFARGMARVRGRRAAEPLFTAAETDEIVAVFVHPRYEPPIEEEYREIETGIAGSLKAAEAQVSRLEKREVRRRQAERAEALRARQRAYGATEAARREIVGKRAVSRAYQAAMAVLGDPRRAPNDEQLGEVLGWTRAAVGAVAGGLQRGAPQRARAVEVQAEELLSGGEITAELYTPLAEEIAKLAEAAQGDRAALEEVATALELLDIVLLLDQTRDLEQPAEVVVQLARFFDRTLNNHIFDCTPYHYDRERGAAFEDFGREERLELAARHHRWLYSYARRLLATKTVVATRGGEYADAWLGDADRDLLAVGVNAEEPAERFWFNYARLRDAVVLLHDGFPLPEVFLNLDPEAIGTDRRTNVVIVYPHGNTTVPVGLEQGPWLAREHGVNLMLCAFPEIVDRNQGKLLAVPDGFMYLGAEDYRAALEATGVPSGEAEQRAAQVGDEGVLVLATFSRPITAHAVFFHFMHPLRPEIGSVRLPLIQPLVWEAATHLKCLLPDMLKGSGIKTADQFNWYHPRTVELPEQEAKAEIETGLRELAGKHETLIVKPEKESGGRQARILPVRSHGRYLDENIAALRDLTYEISKTDNVVVQEVLRSYVRRLYSREFLEDMVDRFARIGVPVLLDRDPRTPLFSYFRQIVVRGKRGYEISHHITVLSTRGIANVGQGGLLYEYRDEIINPKYREDLRREITKAAYGSLESQRRYTAAHWREILAEYLSLRREFAGRVKLEVGEDLTGFADTDIPYEMGDYMPVLLVDENDCLTRLWDADREAMVPLFDEQGRATDVQVYDAKGDPIRRTNTRGEPLPIPMFDPDGGRLERFDAQGRPISTLAIFKIEPNPGAGLWRPHNDQLPPDRKGEGVRIIFRCLGERGEIYREKLDALGLSLPACRPAGPGRHLGGAK